MVSRLIRAVSPEETTRVPAWITSDGGRKQYLLGISSFHSGKEDRFPEPLTERYFLDNLRWMSESGCFNGKRDLWAMEHLGFILGMLSQQQ